MFNYFLIFKERQNCRFYAAVIDAGSTGYYLKLLGSPNLSFCEIIVQRFAAFLKVQRINLGYYVDEKTSI